MSKIHQLTLAVPEIHCLLTIREGELGLFKGDVYAILDRAKDGNLFMTSRMRDFLDSFATWECHTRH